MNASMRFLVWGHDAARLARPAARSPSIGFAPRLFVGAVGAFSSVLPIALSPIRALREFPERGGATRCFSTSRAASSRKLAPGPAPADALSAALPSKAMPELPEMEAWRRQLNDPVSAFPIAKAGPAHIATLKTFDPPLAALEGRRFARRRAARQAAPLPHRGRRARAARPPDDLRPPEVAPRRRRRARRRPRSRSSSQGGSKLVLTEDAKKKRAGVWLLTPEAAEAELDAPRPGGARPRRGRARRDPPRASRAGSTRCCATSARSPASAARGRTRSSTRRSSRPTRSRPTSTTRRSRASPPR